MQGLTDILKWARFAWNYISYRKGLLAALIVCAVIMSIAELSIPWLIKEAIDAVLEGDEMFDLNRWLLLTAAVLAGLYLTHALLLRFSAQMILHCTYNLRRRLFEHIHKQSLPFFQRHQTGELMHRVTSDTKVFENGVAPVFRDVPSEIVTMIGVIILMLFLHMELGLLIVAYIIVTAGIAGYLGQSLPTLRKSAQNIGARLIARFQEAIAGVRTVKAFRSEQYELNRLDVENRRIRDVEIKEGKVYALMEPLGDMIELLGLVLVVWYGGYLIMGDEITAGALVAFIAYMEILARPLGRVENYYRNIQSSRAAGERLMDLLEDQERFPTPIKIYQSDVYWPVEVQNVSFRHSGSNRYVLNKISFTVHPGQIIAVAGRNGSGKSTLMDLLLRFYDPSSGRILAGGVDLRKWDIDIWRQFTGLMTQDVFLFHGTIRENITYGDPEATPEDIEKAVHDSGLYRLMDRFPNGMDTTVGERGSQLSGGERQTIALARLFLRSPQLLILDEPTSQLDGEALQHIRAALEVLMKGRTSFLVTHNPETLRLADRILFLDNGELVTNGTHKELFTSNLRYQALWEGSE